MRSRGESIGLLGRNHAECAGEIALRTGRKEELVRPAVFGRSAPELNSPKLVDRDDLAGRVLNRADVLASHGIEAVDVAVVGVVRDQQGVAERTEIAGRDRHPPRLVQVRTLGQPLHERTVLAENVNEPTGGSGVAGKRHVDLAVDVLDAKRREARGKRRVGKRFYPGEAAVINIHLVVSGVRREEKVP